MKIQILGTGCPKCKQLMANAEQAVRESGADAQIEKVSDLQEIMKFGVMMTPALAVDGEVKSSGKVISAKEIAEIIRK
ncbi:MAG TPA: thioredoxin family protein [Armatimonadetes bacterium]|jgi:small redox-active disulfide protein 2|nr:thioredoxin family protein [Armatimonadota bacterium]